MQQDAQPSPTADRTDRLQVLVTGHEAYPVFERCFLTAEQHISMSFRIFDPATRLRSKEALRIGNDWMDLLAHTLRRGVSIDLVISDFDCLLACDVHQGTWSSMRRLAAVREMAGPGAARLNAVAALHPARVGILPRLLMWPKILGEVADTCRKLMDLEPHRRDRSLKEMPGFDEWVCTQKEALLPRRWPLPPLTPCSHHQKIAVFDQKRLYVGGLDLDERRYDTPRHLQAAGKTWQDVQLLLEDSVLAQAAQRHLDEFLDVTAGRKPPSDCAPLLRTLSGRRPFALGHLSPKRHLSDIAKLHFSQVKSAKRLIYLESQFLRSVSLARKLARAGRRNTSLGLILILPAAPEEIAFMHRDKADTRFGEYLQGRCIRILRRAFGMRLFVGCPAQARDPEAGEVYGRGEYERAPLVYVHSKVSIFDDSCAIVSSANLNGRSFFWDTEAGVALHDPEEIALLKHKVMHHWLPSDAGERYTDPDTAVQAWRVLANSNKVRAPKGRQGFVLPYTERPARLFGRSFPGVPEEMV